MLDELEWAAADLEHASTLYEQAITSDQSLSETWQSQGHIWHIRAWRDVIGVPSSGALDDTIQGHWNVTLTARGPSGEWAFSKSSDGWFANSHTQP